MPEVPHVVVIGTAVLAGQFVLATVVGRRLARATAAQTRPAPVFDRRRRAVRPPAR